VEDVLDRDDVRLVSRDLPRQAGVEIAQPILDGTLFSERQDPVAQVPDASAAGVLDDAEAAVPRARINPKHPHAFRIPQTANASDQPAKRPKKSNCLTAEAQRTQKKAFVQTFFSACSGEGFWFCLLCALGALCG
jgi:hypothetical protein